MSYHPHTPKKNQDYTRYQVAKHLKKIQTQQPSKRSYSKRTQYEEIKVSNSIKDKLSRNKALITTADKGSSIIIVYQHQYEKKS